MLNEDFLDLLSALLDADVKFMIVGSYAVGVHARPRATKDLDVWAAGEGGPVAPGKGERLLGGAGFADLVNGLRPSP